MQRIIKFRGKRVYNGEWVFGSYFKDFDGSLFIIPSGMGIFAGQKVTPETLGQFTGLKDKNGKEIYLDDLSKDEENDYFKVIQQDNGIYALQMPSINYIDEFIFWDEVEIIGNIHDNPELLK